MARIRAHNFETPTDRLKLPVRKKSYSVPLGAPDIPLLYRRNLGAGAWSVKTKQWLKKIGVADDFETIRRLMTKTKRCGERRTGRIPGAATSVWR